ncbi:ATP cone domain-containing protein [Halobacteriovorax sp. GB3]|uniref:ATP cone domain-containing protein n=1 Tax=Halobacteriovorax sp. GB3 TaxID=2719615 RepID=UPI00235EA9E5|nr:ATP cone domain-containing protein [Halobacteriovorax sp. GB3]MDD0853175.1 ATP cone domain-containing protein [Halobacteriovorax sp. GB3]
MTPFLLRKRNKQQERYDKRKLKKSLRRSGLHEKTCNELVEKMEKELSREVSTTKLHGMARRELEKHSKVAAANYHIKRAMELLGPTGYPFEILCSELLKMKGFKTKVSLNVKGQFVSHEVDVYATRADMDLMCECKYHNSRTHKNDIKTALYVYARSLDIKANPISPGFDHFLIISNTYFSKDAITYAEGVGLGLISMNYPDSEYNLVENIIRYKVYPVTVLKSLKVSDAKSLLGEGIVVIRQLKRRRKFVQEHLGLDHDKMEKIIEEINCLLAKAINSKRGDL